MEGTPWTLVSSSVELDIKTCPAYLVQGCSRHHVLAHPTPISKPSPWFSSTIKARKAKHPLLQPPLQLGVVT